MISSLSDHRINYNPRRTINFVSKCLSDSESDAITYYFVDDETNPYRSSSPLHRAAHDICLTKCKAIIETGEYDVNSRASDGRTPLMVVCSRARRSNNKAYELAVYLLNMGANPNIKDKDGDKALQQAVKSHNYDLVTLLIEHGADRIKLSRETQWLLEEATKKKDKSMMTKFVRWGCSIFGFSRNEYTPLMVAVSINYYRGAKWFLRKAGNRAAELADIQTSDGATCVAIAASSGYASILQLLIKCGANCNVLNRNHIHPITLAALNKHPECVELLLPHVDRKILMATDFDPVMAATCSRSFVCVYLLLKSGYSTEIPYYWEERVDRSTYTYPLFNRKYCTALYHAVRNEDLSIVELLLSSGAKMTFTDIFFSPFLSVLRSYYYLRDDIFVQFLKNDVDINAISVDSNFRVPDALLVSLFKSSLLHVLLSCGLDPMLKNWCKCKNGRSLLEAAMRSSDARRMKDLLKLLLHYSPTIPSCCNEIANIVGTNMSKVPTLRHLCRFSIRKLVPTSGLLHGQFLKDLPLPRRLKNYLNYYPPLFSSSLPLSFQSLSV